MTRLSSYSPKLTKRFFIPSRVPSLGAVKHKKTRKKEENPAFLLDKRGFLWYTESVYLVYGILRRFCHDPTSIPHARILDNGSKTFGWIFKQFNFSLPFIVICIFQYAVYHKHDRRDGVACQEMLWEIVLVAVLTYGVLLPYLTDISDALYTNAVAMGVEIPKTEGKVEETLIMDFHEWFIRLSVPLLALGIFYATRARRERLFPETEADEPLMTRAEYDARKAAAPTAASKEEDPSAATVPAEPADPSAPVSQAPEVASHE